MLFISFFLMEDTEPEFSAVPKSSQAVKRGAEPKSWPAPRANGPPDTPCQDFCCFPYFPVKHQKLHGEGVIATVC